ncbi:unnamed protein product [Penicillium salamii]|uniref:Antifungal protein n=1 Tax=Penicillium salamii TaxID=1612424 RepID=A0A9W4IVN4_9EURO|nr:unnamed protein product [Penicillium salamii]CAG8041440.1 unnamed protein product [Penicillium salamii]CAG8341804.1 unnamed protein product [Penicillium salamii]CAG8342867.1 unnamed protein product [Penicillium salamii]CAG8343068.1 unnamed protein product [Penicillium salamii]
MQITKVAIFLFAAVGVVANPIATESNDIDARASTKQQGCRNDRDACTYDTHHKKVDCQL